VKIHEYQAKTLFADFGIPVPKGEVARTGAEAGVVAERLGGRVVVKAQIHAGGRGKGGGIKVVNDAAAAEQAAASLIGSTLVTPQTGSEGRRVSCVLVEQQLDISRELYLGLLIDRDTALPVLMASSAGGMDIEQVAAETPELILREYIGGYRFKNQETLFGFQARRLAFGLGLEGAAASEAVAVMKACYQLFRQTDASLIEINPLVVTKSGQVLALDAKVSLDDSALFRHPELVGFRDLGEEEKLEIEASKFSLNYIRLDGDVGCMVNGAGLAMATMDIIKLAGGEPANFLDVGGGANAEQIRNAFRILMADENVKAVLINIFGGILRCDVLAEGVIAAVTTLDVSIPIVIRMEGTNVDVGKRMLQQSGLNFTTADTMGEAAESVVKFAKIGRA
jgi:succinyl-CoA synthetase beta subunit